MTAAKPKTAKTVAFRVPAKPIDADSWVGQSDSAPAEPGIPGIPSAPARTAEPMRRFTIDVPVSLHTKIKIGCARRGAKMADTIRELLEREFASEA
jgi:hypothetical protein